MEYAPLISSEPQEESGMVRNCHAAGVGFGFDAHKHPWSHTVVCTAGSLKITVDGVETTIVAGDEPFEMPGRSLHSMEVLEDGTEFYTEHPADLSGYDHFEVL